MARILCPLDPGEGRNRGGEGRDHDRPPARSPIASRSGRRIDRDQHWRPRVASGRRRARRFFERMALEAGGGEWAQAVVRTGDPRSALEDLARRCGAEVVISGSHGRSIRGVLLGGVSRHLTKRSARAVIVVPPEASRRWEGGEPERGTLNSIVCGVDGSMVGFEAAEAAGQVAAGLGARLTLVHAYLPVPPVGFTTPHTGCSTLARSPSRSAARACSC